jgi:hypothetical protein
VGVVTNDIRGLATNATPALPAPFNDPAFWPAFAVDVGGLLLYDYLERNQRTLFAFFRFLGVADVENRPATGTRSAFRRRGIRWDRLVVAGTNPVQLFRVVYGWDGVFEYARLFENSAALAAGFGAPISVEDASPILLNAYYDAAAPARRNVAELRIPLFWAVVTEGGPLAFVQVALTALPMPPAGNRTADPVGFALFPAVQGAAGIRFDVTDWLEGRLSGGFESVGAVRLEIRPTGAGVSVSPTLAASIAAEGRLTASPPQPWLLFGARDSTRFELAGAHASIGARGVLPEMDALIEIAADSAALVLDFGEGDGFLQKAAASTPHPLGMVLEGRSRTGGPSAGGRRRLLRERAARLASRGRGARRGGRASSAAAG